MNKIYKITERYRNLPYMWHDQAVYLRDVIQTNGFSNLCELGHYHGKSSIYIGAILEEQGYGKLTTYDLDKTLTANQLTPSIRELIAEFELESYIQVVTSKEGYGWDLSDRIISGNTKYDFCYIDGGHNFQLTLMAFVLTDILMQPGGIVIFDDINWTINTGGQSILESPIYKYSTPRQRNTPLVKMVCDVVMPHYNYTLLDWNSKLGWAVYRKNG